MDLRIIDCLNMNITINDSTGVMYTEDKIRYSVEERLLLKTIDYQIPLQVHLIKKVFDRTIISLESKELARIDELFFVKIIFYSTGPSKLSLLETQGK